MIICNCDCTIVIVIKFVLTHLSKESKARLHGLM